MNLAFGFHRGKNSEMAGGVSGTEIYDGYIQTQVSTLKQVAWDDDDRYEYVDEMKTDSCVESVLNAIQLPIKAAAPSIEPASDDNVDMRIADALEQDLLHNPHFSKRGS